MQNKNLVIFTMGFPYGESEFTFLNEEIKILTKYFEKVSLVPLKSNSADSKASVALPDNVTVIDNVAPEKSTRSASLMNYLFAFKLILIEFVASRNLRLFKNIRYHLSELMLWIDTAANIDELLKKNIISENDLYYTYWFDSWTSALIVMNLKYRRNIKIISRAHGFDLYAERNIKGYIFPRHLQMCYIDKVFPISKQGGEYLAAKFPKFKHKISYSRLGIKKEYKNAQSEKNSDQIVLVSCSLLFMKLKRVHKIIEILSYSTKPVKWIHFGDGTLKAELIELSLTLPKHVSVDFKGNVENSFIKKFYSENYVDWFINVSETEGLPVSIMEAVSFGIPAIAPDIGGIKEIVTKTTGILIKKHFNAKEVMSFIENPIFNSQDRSLIVEFWKENYSAEKNFSHFAEQIRQI